MACSHSSPISHFGACSRSPRHPEGQRSCRTPTPLRVRAATTAAGQEKRRRRLRRRPWTRAREPSGTRARATPPPSSADRTRTSGSMRPPGKAHPNITPSGERAAAATEWPCKCTAGRAPTHRFVNAVASLRIATRLGRGGAGRQDRSVPANSPWPARREPPNGPTTPDVEQEASQRPTRARCAWPAPGTPRAWRRPFSGMYRITQPSLDVASLRPVPCADTPSIGRDYRRQPAPVVGADHLCIGGKHTVSDKDGPSPDVVPAAAG